MWRGSHRRVRVVATFAALIGAAGCGPDTPVTYPVKGRVTYPDGSPLQGGMIECQLIPETAEGVRKNQTEPVRGYNARGQVDNDGFYTLTTFADGDGAVPGRHRVIVMQAYPGDGDEAIPVLVIDPKYRRYSRSGLEIEVKTGENDIPIEVTRPGRSK